MYVHTKVLEQLREVKEKVAILLVEILLGSVVEIFLVHLDRAQYFAQDLDVVAVRGCLVEHKRTEHKSKRQIVEFGRHDLDKRAVFFL